MDTYLEYSKYIADKVGEIINHNDNIIHCNINYIEYIAYIANPNFNWKSYKRIQKINKLKKLL